MTITNIEATRSPFGRVLQDVSQAATLDEAMRLGGLDFTVTKAELSSVHLDENGGTITDYPNYRGIVRTDTRKSLAVVSDTYGIVQNHDAFSPLDYLQREGIVSGFDQAGMIGGGARVFMLATLGSESTIEGDPHIRKVLIATSHDGTGSVTARGWLHRVTCANQVPAMFFNGKAQPVVGKIRHTSRAETYLAQFRQAVLGAVQSLDHMERQIRALSVTRASSDDVVRFCERMFPLKDESIQYKKEYHLSRGEKTTLNRVRMQRHTLRSLIEQAPTQENVRGTNAALFHAAVEYSDYLSSGKRAERIVTGRDAAFKAKALVLAGGVR